MDKHESSSAKIDLSVALCALHASVVKINHKGSECTENHGAMTVLFVYFSV
jgi:hypothetical protein